MTNKEQMVGTRLPESFITELKKIEQFEQSDRSTVLRKLLYRAVSEWKLEHYAKEYGQDKMTLSKAAEEAGVSVWEMMEYLRERKITAQYSLEDLEHDLRDIYKKTEQSPA